MARNRSASSVVAFLCACFVVTGCNSPLPQLNAASTATSALNTQFSGAADLVTELKYRANESRSVYGNLYPSDYDVGLYAYFDPKAGKRVEKFNDPRSCKEKYDLFHGGYNTTVVESRKQALTAVIKTLQGLIKTANAVNGQSSSQSSDLDLAQQTFQAVATDLKDAPVGSEAAAVVKIADQAQKWIAEGQAYTKLKSDLNSNGKDSIWSQLDAAVKNLEDTNPQANEELQNAADVWEACQNAIVSSSGNVNSSSPHFLKLSSASLQQAYDRDLRTLSALLDSDQISDKTLKTDLENIRSLIAQAQAALNNPTPDLATLLADSCSLGATIGVAQGLRPSHAAPQASPAPHAAAPAPHGASAAKANSPSQPGSSSGGQSQQGSSSSGQSASCASSASGTQPASGSSVANSN